MTSLLRSRARDSPRPSIFPNSLLTTNYRPNLRNSPLVKINGQTYGVPFVWGPNPLLFDTTAFAQPPDSWSVLWDPKYKGKISLWDELSSVYMAAQVLGYDKPDPYRIYNLSDEQLEAVKKKANRTQAKYS